VCLLKKLSEAKDQKQPEKTIKTYVQKQLGLDAASVSELVEELVRDQIVARLTKGASSSLKLTPAAVEYRTRLPVYPPPPPPPDEKLKCLVLMELAAAGEKRLVTKEIAASLTAAMQKTLGIAKAMVAPAISYLALQNWVDQQETGKSGKDEKISYRLTEQGKEELARVPEAIKALFPHLKTPTPEMKSFVLMEMLAAGDRRLLKAEIEKILSKPAGKQLGLLKQMAAPLLVSLGREKLVAEEIAERSGKASYQLTERGKTELARGGQHPGTIFSLSGAAINELLRHAGAAAGADVKVTAQPPAHDVPAPKPAHQAPQLSDDTVIGEAKDLLRERHGHTGLVPIFELRRRIKAKFGDLPASHSDLDGRLKRLRREYRLRLVSISDRSRATAEELSESVPGEEEMFFYVGELR
jgi:DNA-binding PadR family transcriptional regulator